jgi:hypothetical protein
MLFTPLVMLVQVVSAALGTLFYGLWIAALARGLRAPVVHGGAGLFYVLAYLPYLYIALFIFSAMTSNGVEDEGFRDAAAHVFWALAVNCAISLLVLGLLRLARYWRFSARFAVGIWPLLYVGLIMLVILVNSWLWDWFEFFMLASMHGLCSLTLLNPLAIPAVAVDPDAWGAFIAIPLSGFRLPFAVVLQLAASAVALNYALKGIALRRREFTE